MHKVAVYGTLREGCGNHRYYLQGQEKLGEQELKGFRMFSLGGFPGVKEHADSSIKIEVYQVPEDVFKMLDRLEGYPSMYDRQEVETEHGPAWMYIWQSVHEGPTITNGDWVSWTKNR